MYRKSTKVIINGYNKKLFFKGKLQNCLIVRITIRTKTKVCFTDPNKLSDRVFA